MLVKRLKKAVLQASNGRCEGPILGVDTELDASMLSDHFRRKASATFTPGCAAASRLHTREKSQIVRLQDSVSTAKEDKAAKKKELA